MVGPDASRRAVAGWTAGVMVSTLIWGTVIVAVLALHAR